MSLDDKLEKLGNNFRGLYTGRLFEEDGYVHKELQYSVTFMFEGEWCETPWNKSVHGAFDFALEKINPIGDKK